MAEPARGPRLPHAKVCSVDSYFSLRASAWGRDANLWAHLPQLTCAVFSFLNKSKGEPKRAWVCPQEGWGRRLMAMGRLWFMNFANSYLWAQSWNKPCDSPAGLSPVISPSRSCAFSSVDLSSYCLLQKNALLPTLPSPCLPGDTYFSSILSGNPQWIGMGDLFISEFESSN